MVAYNAKVKVQIRDALHADRVQVVEIGIIDVPEPPNAPRRGRYHVTAARDSSYNFDMTTFVPSQEFIAEDNLPFIMSTLSGLDAPVSYGPREVALDPTQVDLWGRPLRLFPGLLPDRISWKVEGWRIAYWLRVGRPLGMDSRDIAARIDSRLFVDGRPCARWRDEGPRLFANLGMRAKRYRLDAGAPSLDHSQYGEQSYERIDRLSDEQVEFDTAWPVEWMNGLAYTLQRSNKWKCRFLLPRVPLKEDVMKAIEYARERIQQKKAVCQRQNTGPRTRGARHYKHWSEVKLSKDDMKRGRKRASTDLRSPVASRIASEVDKAEDDSAPQMLDVEMSVVSTVTTEDDRAEDKAATQILDVETSVDSPFKIEGDEAEDEAETQMFDVEMSVAKPVGSESDEAEDEAAPHMLYVEMDDDLAGSPLVFLNSLHQPTEPSYFQDEFSALGFDQPDDEAGERPQTGTSHTGEFVSFCSNCDDLQKTVDRAGTGYMDMEEVSADKMREYFEGSANNIRNHPIASEAFEKGLFRRS